MRLRGTLIRLLAIVVIPVVAASLTLVASPKTAEARYAAVVVDAETGEVLYSRNAAAARYPASLTKMMTLYMAFEALDSGKLKLGQELKVSKRAAGQTPSKLGLSAGSTIKVQDAILAMVTKSANDAATVVAEALGGTEIKFAEMMTDRARELGMRRTTFRNATGLPNRNQRSTAADMSLLAIALLRDHPGYYHYFSTQRFVYGGRTYTNHNHLLGKYEGTDGIKTGYIRASGFNVVASVKRGDRRLIGVVFGGKTANSRDSHARSLFDRAFSVLEARNIPTPARKPVPPDVDEPQLAADAPAEAGAPEQGSTDGDRNDAALPERKPRPERQVVARALDADGRNWLIQVGAFSDPESAYQEIRRAAAVVPQQIENARASVSETETRDGRALYRARIVGMTQADAYAACGKLQKNRIGCVPLSQTDG